MSGLEIVRIGSADIERCRALWEELRVHHLEQRPDLPPQPAELSWRLRREFYQVLLRSPNSFALVASDSGRDVGYAMVHVHSEPDDTWDLGDRVAELETLAVSAKDRGRGVGTALVARVRSELSRFAPIDLRLAVVPENARAGHFYAREGFTAFLTVMHEQLAAPTTPKVRDESASPHRARAPLSIRRAEPSDRDTLESLAVRTGMFPADGLDDFSAALDDFFGGGGAHGGWFVATDVDDQVVGGCALVPESSSGVWNLLFLAVEQDRRRRGIGSALVTHIIDLVEREETDARLLIVQTSALAQYQPARDLYAHLGFSFVARVPDYYDPGEDMLYFTRPLSAKGAPG